MEPVDIQTLFDSLRECTDLGLAGRAARGPGASGRSSPDVSVDAVTPTARMARGQLHDDRVLALEARLRDRLVRGTQVSPALTTALESLLTGTCATAAALVMEDGTSHRCNRVLASVGARHWAALDWDLTTALARGTTDRLLIPFRVARDRFAALELLGPASGAFPAVDVAAYAKAVSVLQLWLSGVVAGGHAQAPRAAPLLDADAFQARALSELDRATRFRAGAGLVVIDTAAGVSDRHELALGPLVRHVRRHLRANDAVGRLHDGRIGVIVVESDERGACSVAQRIGQAPTDEDAGGDRESPMVGVAWFPTVARDWPTLVATALEELNKGAAPLWDGIP